MNSSRYNPCPNHPQANHQLMDISPPEEGPILVPVCEICKGQLTYRR